MTESFGFKKEVLSKYDIETYSLFNHFFRTLPLAAVIENAIFVTHGGLGPTTFKMSIEELNNNEKHSRFNESDQNAVMDELLWCDPVDEIQEFGINEERGGGYVFGSKVTEYFLHKNNLELLVRSHQVKDQGIEVQHNGRCITVFSAPNYVGQVGNLGAILKYGEASKVAGESEEKEGSTNPKQAVLQAKLRENPFFQ
jgi:serine/threonine-protein phosphatase 5